MSKRNAYGRRKAKSQMRRSKKQERTRVHVANCAKMARKKRKEAALKVN